VENYSTLTRDKSFQKRTLKYVISGIILLVIIYGAIFIAETYFAGNTPTGAPGSSYATVKSGVNAWGQLLSQSGYEVVKDKGTITLPKLSNVDEYSSKSDVLDLTRETTTVIVLENSLPQYEIDQVQKFVKNGGRLITDNPDILLSIFKDDLFIDLSGSIDQKISNSNINGTNDINEIEGSGVGSIAFSSKINAEKLLVPIPQNALGKSNKFGTYSNAAIFQLEKGDVIALVDNGPITNEGLSRKDNALFSLRITGEVGNKVIFAEGIHGFSNATGFNAMPISWKISIIGLIAAFIIFGSYKARRFGVGEEPPRDLGPKRILYAKALTQAMKKSKR
jgi:hypothetical protein